MIRAFNTRAFDVLFVALALLGAALLLLKHDAFFHDDAYITLRYAVNFAETGLPQWNRGEWVEGFTSWLHLGLLALLIWLGLPAVFAAQALNAVSALALLYFTWIAARHVAPDQDMRVDRRFVFAAVAVSPPLAVWVLGGLEAVLVGTLLTAGLAALLAHLREPRPYRIVIVCVAFSLAILTRLDASVFVAGAGIGLVLAAKTDLRTRIREAIVIVGVPAAVAFAQMGIRLNVYGEFFPLTFYAKADLPLGERITNGLPYLLDGLWEVSVIGVSLIALAAAIFWGAFTRSAVLLLCPVLLQLLYIVWAGGDHMLYSRMLVPLIAPTALLLLALTSEMRAPQRRLLFSVAIVASVLQGAVNDKLRRDPAAFAGEIVGPYIAATWPSGITIANNSAGGVPFYAGRDHVFVDMLGLNDPVIAKREDVPILAFGQEWPGHLKGDGAYVLERAPDRIIIGPAPGTDVDDPWFLSDAELALMPEFAECYERRAEEIRFSIGDERPKRVFFGPHSMIFVYYTRVCP
ncbi:MAG: hypothetical protein AAF376_00385 [Pseudomonadota bacterium]